MDLWGAIDVIRDPYTDAQPGGLRITALEGMRRRHVLEIKAEMSATPSQANKTLKRLSQLIEIAIDLEWRTDNPVRGVERFRSRVLLMD